jgi:galactokinase
MNPVVATTEQRTRATFEASFGRPPRVVSSAPGRVNLIGDHTDYNGGFVLPTVLPLRTYVALAPRDDSSVLVGSDALPEGGSFAIGSERRRDSWIDYVQGVTAALRVHGYELRGFDAWIGTELPLGSGLSSSASLSVAVLRALSAAFGFALEDVALARMAQWGENHVVGAPVGILDPMACQLGAVGQALFIDTMSLEHRRLPLPSKADLLVMDSGVRHAHATGGYRTRRAECEAAARALGVNRLRDLPESATLDFDLLPPPLGARVRHVRTENARVLAAVQALEADDAETLGRLFDASHASLRDDYEVSVPEVDRLVDAAHALPGVFGARITGGGFGGAVVCLVRKGQAAVVARELAALGKPVVVPSHQEGT